MNTGGRSNNFRDGLVVKLTDRVSERPGCVDDALCADLELVWLLAILDVDHIHDSGSVEASVGVLCETGDFEMVDDSRSVERSSHSERDVHAGVVVCTIVVYQSSNQIVLLEHRECI